MVEEVEDGFVEHDDSDTIPMLWKDKKQLSSDEEKEEENGGGSVFFYVVVTFVSLGGFIFGYATAVISGAMISLKRVYDMTILEEQVVVGIAIAGAIVGALLSGVINDKGGRRLVLLISSALFTIGSVVLGVANGVVMLIIGRLVAGVGIGLTAMTVPVYLAETAPLMERGKFVTVYNFSVTLGQFLASLMNGGFSYLKTNGWRCMLGISALPSAIMFIGCWFAPESPRWLIQNDRLEDAREVIKSLRDVKDIDAELNDIQFAVAKEVKTPMLITFKRMLSTRSTSRALVLGCGLQAIQQLSAINTVMYYSASIIQMAGVEDENMIFWLTAVVGFGYSVFALISIYIVERVGRRILTLSSVAGLILALLTLSLTFYLLDRNTPEVTFNSSYNLTNNCANQPTCWSCVHQSACGFCYSMTHSKVTYGTCLVTGRDTRPPSCNVVKHTSNRNIPMKWTTQICPSKYAWLAVWALIFYLAMFAFGLGPMPWTINAEIYPLWARNAGTSASTATNKIMNMVVSLTFLSLMEYLTRPGVFLFYAGLTFAGFLFLYEMLPETKGRKLEDVEELFRTR